MQIRETPGRSRSGVLFGGGFRGRKFGGGVFDWGLPDLLEGRGGVRIGEGKGGESRGWLVTKDEDAFVEDVDDALQAGISCSG